MAPEPPLAPALVSEPSLARPQGVEEGSSPRQGEEGASSIPASPDGGSSSHLEEAGAAETFLPREQTAEDAAVERVISAGGAWAPEGQPSAPSPSPAASYPGPSSTPSPERPGSKPSGTTSSSSPPRMPALLGFDPAMDDDFMFSFKKIRPQPSPSSQGSPMDEDFQKLRPGDAASFYMPGRHPPSLSDQEGTPATKDHAATAAASFTCGSSSATAPPLSGNSSVSPAGTTMAHDKESLRLQLQELELMSLGWRTRLMPSSPPPSPSAPLPPGPERTGLGHRPGSEDGQVDDGTNAGGDSGSSDQEDKQPGLEGHPLEPRSPAAAAAAFPPLCSRPAPYVAATCSEDEDDGNMLVYGGVSGSDTDDTDELLARKSCYVAAPEPAAAAAAAAARRLRSGAEDGAEAGPSVTAVTTTRPLPQLGPGQSNDDWLFGFSVKTKPTSGSAAAVLHPGMAGTRDSSMQFPGASGAAARVLHPGLAGWAPPASAVLPSQAASSFDRQIGSMPSPDVTRGASQDGPWLPAESPQEEVPGEGSSGLQQSPASPTSALPAPLLASKVEVEDEGDIQVQRVQFAGSSSSPAAGGFRFANRLPPVPSDIDLTFNGFR